MEQLIILLDLSNKSNVRVAVIGAGAWGTALAHHVARQGFPVNLWARRAELVERISLERENSAFLPGLKLPSSVAVLNDPEKTVNGASLILWVVPSHGLRAVVQLFAPFLDHDVVQICASKGIEDESFATMSQVLLEETPEDLKTQVGVLSGPSFAVEVASGLPTGVTLAIANPEMGQVIQVLLSSPTFRIYTSTDILGVELGGALKNIYAIAAGISDGLALGLNARASLLTRGLGEMSLLGKVMGANPMTLTGLSGMGDLILTATGELSRNRRVGLRLGGGEKLEDILAGSREVAEGVKNARSVWGLAQKYGVGMPMAREVYRVLYENKQPRQGMVDLLTRRLKEELHPELL